MEISQEEKLISMAEASKITPYEQDYLSLMARRGMIRAEKIGKKWYTKVSWLNEYLSKSRPEDVILEEESGKRNRFRSGWLLIALAVLFGVGAFFWFLVLPNLAKDKFTEDDFIVDEILKVPNEKGGYDVYQSGRVKLGEEENSPEGGLSK